MVAVAICDAASRYAASRCYAASSADCHDIAVNSPAPPRVTSQGAARCKRVNHGLTGLVAMSYQSSEATVLRASFEERLHLSFEAGL